MNNFALPSVSAVSSCLIARVGLIKRRYIVADVSNNAFGVFSSSKESSVQAFYADSATECASTLLGQV